MMFGSFGLRKQWVPLLLVLVLSVAGLADDARGVTRFSAMEPSKTLPAALNLNDIWFYNADRDKTIPDIDLEWISVVFRPASAAFDSLEPAAPADISVHQQARDLLAGQSDLADYYYDRNLADDACFFELRPDMTLDQLPALFAWLNSRESVSYAHPALKIKGRTYAFFNAFTLVWKSGVAEDEKTSILNQVPVAFDRDDQVFRVDVAQKSFFQALNLLAEDIRVSQAAPYLVEIKPTLSGEVSVGIAGGNSGDRIPFALRIEFSPRVAIDPSSLATINLRPQNIQKELFEITFDPYDYSKAILNSPILITGGIRFYAPGDFIIPPVEIKYHCPECSQPQDRSFETKPIMVRISSLVPAAQRDSKLIVPQQPTQISLPTASVHRAALINLAVSVACLALAAIGAAWCWMRGQSLRKERKRLLLAKKEDVLAEKLRLVMGREPIVEPRKFLSEVNRLFREYVAGRYRISPVPTGGSGSVFWEAIRHQMPEDAGLKAKIILEAMDRMAAHESTETTAIQSMRQAVEEFLDLTRPRSTNG